MRRRCSKKYGKFTRQTRVIRSLRRTPRNFSLLYHRLRSTKVRSPIISNFHVKGVSQNESCNSMENTSNQSLQDIDWQKLTNFPRVQVNSFHPNVIIEIITRSGWCLLSSILVLLEEENLEVSSAHTICVAEKVFYTIFAKVVETGEIDCESLRTKLYFVAVEKSEGTCL